jgi:hypothetical protein
LWWSYDTIGFGPGRGLQEGGHTLLAAWVNLRFSLAVLSKDLFGWPYLSFIFLPFGIWAGRRSAPAWLLLGLIPSILFGYGLYWITSWLFGPRYYFEALPAFTIFTAAGLWWCAGLFSTQMGGYHPGDPKVWMRRVRLALTTLVASLLISTSLLFYMPIRLASFYGLYGVARQHVLPFLRPEFQAQTPALIIVHKQISWYEYGTLIDLETPYLNTPYVFIYDPSLEEEASIVAQFPGRKVFHYYHDDPYHLYLSRKY